MLVAICTVHSIDVTGSSCPKFGRERGGEKGGGTRREGCAWLGLAGLSHGRPTVAVPSAAAATRPKTRTSRERKVGKCPGRRQKKERRTAGVSTATEPAWTSQRVMLASRRVKAWEATHCPRRKNAKRASCCPHNETGPPTCVADYRCCRCLCTQLWLVQPSFLSVAPTTFAQARSAWYRKAGARSSKVCDQSWRL